MLLLNYCKVIFLEPKLIRNPRSFSD